MLTRLAQMCYYSTRCVARCVRGSLLLFFFVVFFPLSVTHHMYHIYIRKQIYVPILTLENTHGMRVPRPPRVRSTSRFTFWPPQFSSISTLTKPIATMEPVHHPNRTHSAAPYPLCEQVIRAPFARNVLAHQLAAATHKKKTRTT